MPKKRRKPKVDADLRTVIVKALTGSAVGTAVFFALTALVSFICLEKDSAPEGYGYFELAVSAVAGFMCGYTAVKPVRKKGIIVGAVSSMPMYLVVVCAATLISHGGLGIMGWIAGAVMLAAGAAGGIVAVN